MEMSAPEVHGLVRLEISKSDYKTANQTRASEQHAGERYSCPPHLRMRHHIHQRRLALARLSEDAQKVTYPRLCRGTDILALVEST